MAEIKLAKEIGATDARRTLIQEYLKERNRIIDLYYPQPEQSVNVSSSNSILKPN